jgi:hypothetical protein
MSGVAQFENRIRDKKRSKDCQGRAPALAEETARPPNETPRCKIR